jgi:hypothetical protein
MADPGAPIEPIALAGAADKCVMAFVSGAGCGSPATRTDFSYEKSIACTAGEMQNISPAVQAELTRTQWTLDLY